MFTLLRESEFSIHDVGESANEFGGRSIVYKVIKTSRDLDQPIRSLDFERVQT